MIDGLSHPHDIYIIGQEWNARILNPEIVQNCKDELDVFIIINDRMPIRYFSYSAFFLLLLLYYYNFF